MCKPKHAFAALAGALAVGGIAACTLQQLATPSGQLFCALVKNGGTTVVSLIDAEASAKGLGPVAIIATNTGADYVNAQCAAAAVATGATSGLAVSPPANPAAAPTVAVLAAK